MDAELEELLRKLAKAYKTMTPEQKAEMHKKQRESWVRAEMSWPKPRYHYENGVRVYETYEDYCNA